MAVNLGAEDTVTPPFPHLSWKRVRVVSPSLQRVAAPGPVGRLRRRRRLTSTTVACKRGEGDKIRCLNVLLAGTTTATGRH